MRGQYKTVCDSEACLAVCDTPKGARASAVFYTLIESAKANGLDVFRYLK